MRNLYEQIEEFYKGLDPEKIDADEEYEYIYQIRDLNKNVYSEINRYLSQYDSAKPLNEQQELFEEIQLIHNLLMQYQDIHINLVKKCNHTLEFIAFCDGFLNTTNISDKDTDYIKFLIFELMSCDTGQRLILELNKIKQQDPKKQIILLQYSSGSFNTGWHVNNWSENGMVDNIIAPESIVRDAGPREYYNCFPTGKTANQVSITLPKNFPEKSVTLYPRLNGGLVYSIHYIVFGHELIHTLHYLTGANREDLTFHPDKQLANLYRGRVEEFFTIEFDPHFNENLIRSENQ